MGVKFSKSSSNSTASTSRKKKKKQKNNKSHKNKPTKRKGQRDGSILNHSTNKSSKPPPNNTNSKNASNKSRPAQANERRFSFDRKSSSSSIQIVADMVKDVHHFLKKNDPETIRTHLGNNFGLGSTTRKIYFAHGDPRQHLRIKPENALALNGERYFEQKDFEFIDIVGKGGFGVVLLGKRITTRQRYAVKVQPMEVMAKMSYTASREPDATLLHMERTVLAACRGNPFIVKLEYAFCTDIYSVLVLEYVAGGTLSHLLSSLPNRQLPVEAIKIYVAELALALNFMHNKGIIYRDLKPSNILLDHRNGHLKLTDFGLAGSLVKRSKHQENGRAGQDDDNNSTYSDSSQETACPEISDQENRNLDTEDPTEECTWIRRRTLCGTRGYRPPEQVLQRYVDYEMRVGYDERADWFALGSTTYTMIVGRRPFPSVKDRESFSEVNVHESLFELGLVDSAALSRAVEDVEFLSLMRRVKYGSRFFGQKKMKSFVQDLLSRNPKTRLNFQGIVDHPWMSDIVVNEKEILKRQLPPVVVTKVQTRAAEDEKILSRRKRHPQSYRNLMMKNNTLEKFVDDLCDHEYEVRDAHAAREYAMRWKTPPSTASYDLFRHWSYISDDAVKHELEALKKLDEIEEE